MKWIKWQLVSAIVLLSILSVTAIAEFEIHFLDVGQADCAIVLCDEQVMLIDGGNAGDSSLVYSYLKNNLQVDTINYVIATHPHEDHVGGIAGALNACTVERLFSPVSDYESDPFQAMVKYCDLQGVSIEDPPVGTSFFLGSSRVKVLAPLHLNYEDINDWSIVLKITYGDTSFLFTGDAGMPVEYDLLASGCDLSADVLKVGHHGSSSATSQEFLEAVDPEYAIISVGEENSYGHPHEETLENLQGIAVYRTDETGHNICYSDGTELQFDFER